MKSVLNKLSRALRHPFSTRYAFKRLAEHHSQPRSLEEVVDWAMNFGGGGTALIWSTLDSERVITCDLQDMSHQAPLFTRLPPPGSSCTVTLLSGDSHDPNFRARVSREINGRQVDFLFIDGDHTEAGVTADYNDYKDFVRPGGLIAFHDTVEHQPLPTNQVFHLWKRLKTLAPVEKFINDPKQCGFGIGLLHVPATGAPTLPA